MYAYSKDLAEKTISDKAFKGRAYEIALYAKYNGYEKRLASAVYRFLIVKHDQVWM